MPYRGITLTKKLTEDTYSIFPVKRRTTCTLHDTNANINVRVFVQKKVKVPKVNSLATTKYSCCGNVSSLISCQPLLLLQMVHTRNVAERHGIPVN